jgi:hypothetical protein
MGDWDIRWKMGDEMLLRSFCKGLWRLDDLGVPKLIELRPLEMWIVVMFRLDDGV